jgi:transcriptional regulator with XRE-family HTH domain
LIYFEIYYIIGLEVIVMSTGIGQRIRKRRKEIGLSQEELANRMGLRSKSTICKVEKGDDNLTSDTVQKYADALETTPAYIMGWKEIPATLSGHDSETVIVQVDKSSSTNTLDKEISERAAKLYDLYLQAPPEIQAAIETLLRTQSHDS